jgi:rhodanese-related sulfurtransferase
MRSGNETTLAGLLERATAAIERLEPAAAQAAMQKGALLIDIRSDLERRREGIVPGSIHIPRTVLEWRVAPDSEWRNPCIGGVGQRLVLICDHGCSSVLAAATLVGLGFARAADVIGGFEGWREAGLPVTAAPPPVPPGELPGTRGPDV